MGEQKNNRVILEGEITSGFVFEYERYGEGFYRVYVAIPRLNKDSWDHIPCLVSDRLVDVRLNMIGAIIKIHGQLRTYNVHEGEKTRLKLDVFIQDLEFLDDFTSCGRGNTVILRGYLCKTPVYRRTPLGREISDVLFAVNRQYNRSDYIPCICWGRNARFASGLYVGDEMMLVGRIQSREYLKDGGIRTAYEVSVNRIDFAWDEGEFGEILRKTMEYEADRIIEEVNSDPSLRDVKAPDEIYERLMEKIKEREK